MCRSAESRWPWLLLAVSVAALAACSGGGGSDEPDCAPPCAAASCTLGTAGYEARAAEPCVSGACVPQEPVGCGPYTCDGGGDLGDLCATSCDGESPARCADGAHCDASVCLADLPAGEACDEGSDCETDHCANGFCCATGDCCQQETDCPTYGTTAPVCEDSAACQGTIGTVACVSNICTAGGAPDDSGCDATTLASHCGPYPAVYCTGAADQAAPVCATSCTTHDDCDPEAHCDTLSGTCAPDVAQAGSCGDSTQCAEGLSCQDGVCCNWTCTGECEACDVAGHVGECWPIPSGSDPDLECGALSCTGYYGWILDSCYRKADVSATQAACDGAGACRSAATECSLSGRGSAQITCDAVCQNPTAGTCTGTTAGTCTNVSAGTQTCGVGACERSAAVCVNGSPNSCVPGTPTAEVCNGIDDDCDGTADEDFPRDTNPSCSTFSNLGSVRGDTGADTLTASGASEAFFRVTVAEDNVWSADVKATISLINPPGVDFDLYLSCASCGDPVDFSNAGAGQTDVVRYGRSDGWGGDDTRDVFVEVRFYSATSCGSWELRVEGNTGTGTATCN